MTQLRKRDRRRVFVTGIAMAAAVLAGAVCPAQKTAAGLVEKRIQSLGRTAGAGRTGETAAGFQRSSDLFLSPNGNSLACLTSTEGGYRFLWNGKPGPTFDLYLNETLCFSADGKRLAYGVMRANRHLVVCDGKEILDARSPALSPDGKLLAHAHMPPTGWKFMTVNGKPIGPKVSDCVDMTVFSPDGKHLAFRASRRMRYWFVVRDGKKERTWGSVGRPVYSPNSRRLAYAVREGELMRVNRSFVICGGTKSGPYDGVGRPVFSMDSRRMAHRAQEDDGWFAVLDGKELARWTRLRDPVFAPTGRSFAYAAALQDRWFVVHNEKRSPSFADVGMLVFSPDGKHLAYWGTRKGETRLVCDEKKCTPFDKGGGVFLWLGFSSDSRHLAYVVRGAGGDRVVCDGVEGPVHERVMVPEHFRDVPGKLRYVVIDKAAEGGGKDPWLVEIDWPVGRTWEDAFKPAGN